MAHDPVHSELVLVSGANQYRVRPLALVRTSTPPILAVLRVAPTSAAATGDPPALTTATPSRARAATETALTEPTTRDIALCALARARRGAPLARAGPAVTAASASVAKAATSIRPAAIPALVRISLKPNNPIQTASRYAPRVDSASAALAAAASRVR